MLLPFWLIGASLVFARSHKRAAEPSRPGHHQDGRQRDVPPVDAGQMPHSITVDLRGAAEITLRKGRLILRDEQIRS